MSLLQRILDILHEDGEGAVAAGVPANNVGGGQIAGLGVGPKGEPGINLKKKKRKTDGDDPLVETAEFVGKANPKNAIYAKLMKKGKPVGSDLYELTSKHVTPEIRRSLSAGFARGPEETDSFYLKHKADVTGIPGDEGYILKDKRPSYIRRFGIKEETDLERKTTALRIGVAPESSAEFWKIGDNVYRAPYKTGKDTTGMPMGKRWECSYQHWLNYRTSAYGWVDDLKERLHEAPVDTFGNADVFDVDMDRLLRISQKHRWERYAKYLELDEVGEDIRQHARKNWKRDIVLRDSKTGVMRFLRRRTS
jgi:hypothetical protein